MLARSAQSRLDLAGSFEPLFLTLSNFRTQHRGRYRRASARLNADATNKSGHHDRHKRLAFYHAYCHPLERKMRERKMREGHFEFWRNAPNMVGTSSWSCGK